MILPPRARSLKHLHTRVALARSCPLRVGCAACTCPYTQCSQNARGPHAPLRSPGVRCLQAHPARVRLSPAEHVPPFLSPSPLLPSPLSPPPLAPHCAVLQHVYYNKKLKKASRANPVKVLAAANAAYQDAWEFVSNPPAGTKPGVATATAAGRGSGGGGGGAAAAVWQQMFDASYGCMYWYNTETGAVGGRCRGGGRRDGARNALAWLRTRPLRVFTPARCLKLRGGGEGWGAPVCMASLCSLPCTDVPPPTLAPAH